MTLTNTKNSLKVLGIFLVVTAYSAIVFYAGNSWKPQEDKNRQPEVVGTIKSPTSVEANDPSLTSQVLASYVKKCSNTYLGFEIAYPKEWFTTFNEPKEQCFHFAPFSFILPYSQDDSATPVYLRTIDPVEWDVAMSESEIPTEYYSISSVANVAVNGLPAKKIEYVSTGEDLQKGFLKVSYLIHNNKSPIILTYRQSDAADDTEKSKSILEEMAQSLKFF